MQYSHFSYEIWGHRETPKLKPIYVTRTRAGRLKIIITAQSIEVFSQFESSMIYFLEYGEPVSIYTTLLNKNCPVLFMWVLISCFHFHMPLSWTSNDTILHNVIWSPTNPLAIIMWIYIVACMWVPEIILLGCGIRLSNGICNQTVCIWPMTRSLFFIVYMSRSQMLESCFCHI